MQADLTEENNQVIQNSYDALVQTPHGRPCREYAERRSTGARSPDLADYYFIISTGLAMIAAGPFAIVLGMAPFLATFIVGDMYWLCSFVLCRGASLHLGTWSLKSWREHNFARG